MIEIIVAMDEHGGIGKHNQLMWHIPADLQRFKNMTTGHAVVMGRNTWESLPEKVRPLPNRTNLVLTTQQDYVAHGATVIHDIKNILEYDKIFVIGGGQIYEQTKHLAHVLHVTRVHASYDADAWFGDVDPMVWKLEHVQHHAATPSYSFLKYSRIHP